MSASQIGQTIGNYRLDAIIGSGGMGHVYRGVHIHLNRPVAVKLMHANLTADRGFQARFLREAQVAASLNHQNVVAVQDFGQHEGQLYLVMELLTDGSVRSLLQERATSGQQWTLGFGIDLVRQAATGLAYAHSRGMVHRDIKPDNLLLQRLGAPTADRAFTVKIGDFGLARVADGGGLTASGVTLGTPAYMSPEQCKGIELDGRSDLYSLGIVLYEVLTGYLPFEAKSLSDAVYKHVYTAPPPPRQVRPDLPESLEVAILRCLEKEPAARYAGANELVAALDAALADRQVAAAPVAPASAAPPPHSVVAAPPSIVAAPPPPPPIAAPPAPPVAVPPPPAFAAPPPPPAFVPPSDGTIVRPDVAIAAPPAAASIVGGGGPQVQILNADGQVQRTVALAEPWLTLGRDDENDIVLKDSAISRRHLRIDWDGRAAKVTDLGSSNGTILGERRLLPQTTNPWSPEEWARAGPFWLRLALAPRRAAAQSFVAAPPPPPSAAAATPVRAATPAIASAEADSDRLRVIVDTPTLTIIPGQPAVVRFTVGNIGTIVDHLTLTVEGVPSSWVRLPPQGVQLNPGTQAPVAMNVSVPRATENYAGEYPVTIRARSRENPNESSTAELVWTVVPFTADSLSLDPLRAGGRTGAQYTATLRNEGNAGTRYRLRGQDQENTLQFAFDPPVIELDPGASRTTRVQITAPRRLIGTRTTRQFEVHADEVSGAAAQRTAGEFVHGALLPIWVPPLALAALAALIFFIVALLNRGPQDLRVDVTPQDRIAGEQVTVSWNVRNARRVEVKVDGTTVTTSDQGRGSFSFVPERDGPLRLEVIASNGAGSQPNAQMISVRKADADEPLIELFDVCPIGQSGSACADPLAITLGEQVVVRWRVKNPQQVTLNILGTLEGADRQGGERNDTPGQTGQVTYTLVAMDAGGATKTRSRRVNVAAPPTAVPSPSPSPSPTVPPTVPVPGVDLGAGQTATAAAANAAATSTAIVAGQAATGTAAAAASAGQAATGTANVAASQTAMAKASPTFTPTVPPVGTWRPTTGQLGTARTGQATVLLNDGRILVAGGLGSTPSATALTSVELFDSATNTWRAVAPMRTGRTGHTATVLDNNTVLVAGGFNSGNPTGSQVDALNTAEVYDLTANTWTVVGSFSAGRALHTATRLNDGRVLIAGGTSNSGGPANNSLLNTAALYNAATRTWAVTPQMRTARIGHIATLLPDGSVLIAGGLSGTGNSAGPVNTAEIFTTSPQPAWNTTGNLTVARAEHAATILPDNRVLITGGRTGPGVTGAVLRSTEIYDPNTRTWTAGVDMRTARAGHTATTISGSGAILVMGGRSGAPNSQPLNSAELLGAGARAWQATGAPAVARANHTATPLRDGRVLVVGGNTDQRTETFQER